MKNWSSNGLTIAGKIGGKKFAYQFCVYILTFGIPFLVEAVREKKLIFRLLDRFCDFDFQSE